MPNKLEIPESVTVRALSVLLNKQPTEVITKLIQNGVMAHINQSLDFDTAALIADEFGFEAVVEVKNDKLSFTTGSKDSIKRPPIVTIMGHVDHGKTTLMDFIRSANVAASESGGITQHISAYQIDFETKDKVKRKITFIDTPGHEAFSQLRAHGVSMTDVVILIVAATDGVKPQTIEVIEKARANNVPIIVAINKIDMPGANVEMVKKQLSEHELMPEEWGGKTTMIPISAKSGQGVADLLEMVILTADLLDLKADSNIPAEGVVIEAHKDIQVGSMATILIYNGTLRPGYSMVVGSTYGKIRSMSNDQGIAIQTAGPATPVIISGLNDVPKFGDTIQIMPNEKSARVIANQKNAKTSKYSEKPANAFRVVIKADVGGSLAALEDSIKKLKHKDAVVEVLQSGIGQVTENDINIAEASGSTIIAFRVEVPSQIKKMNENKNILIKEFWVIYEIIEFLSQQLEIIATPTYVTEELGRLKILQIFNQKGTDAIVGGEVAQGKAVSKSEIIIQRNGEEIGKAKMTSLKAGKIDTDEVDKGVQCGVGLSEVEDIAEGDVLIFAITKKV